jgi:hypothetical protein
LLFHAKKSGSEERSFGEWEVRKKEKIIGR